MKMNLQTSEEGPPVSPVPISDAVKRRRMRARLVQDHIAKISLEDGEPEQNAVPVPVEEQKFEIPTSKIDTSRVQVVEARGGKQCRIVVDTPPGHSAGRLKLVLGFERLEVEEQEEKMQAKPPPMPKQQSRAPVHVQPGTSISRPEKPTTATELSTAPISRNREVIQPELIQVSAPEQVSAPQTVSKAVTIPQASISKKPQVTSPPRPLQRKTAIAPQRIPSSQRPDGSATAPKAPPPIQQPQQQQGKRDSVKTKSQAPQKTSKPAPKKPSAPKSKTSTKQKVPPPTRTSSTAPQQQRKLPPSQRTVSKVPQPQSKMVSPAARPAASASQRKTVRRSNAKSKASTGGQSDIKQKDTNSWDGGSNETPEPSEPKQSPEGVKQLYKTKRKFANEDLKKRFGSGTQKVKGPPLVAAAPKRSAASATSREKSKVESDKPQEPKKVLKVFRM